MNRNLKIVIFLMLLITNGLSAQDWIRVFPLKGEWKFSIGDNLAWASPDFDASEWETIFAPSTWEDQGFHGYNGYAWYRKHFTIIDLRDDDVFYLHLGYIDDVDEVYINGKLLGHSGNFPPKYETAYNAQRTYPIPAKFLNKGVNLIAVRVYDAQLGGGIISGDLGIYKRDPGLELDMNLEGEWNFAIGDDTERKEINYNDSGWEKIFVPGYWEVQGYKEYNGIAWYRKNVVISESLSKEKLVLMLGKIDDIDETYVNGVLVGSTGKFSDDEANIAFSDEWNELRGYYIPDNLIKPNQVNTIAVRVYDGYIDGGIYTGPIGIVTQKEYIRFWKKRKNVKQNFWETLFESLNADFN